MGTFCLPGHPPKGTAAQALQLSRHCSGPRLASGAHICVSPTFWLPDLQGQEESGARVYAPTPWPQAAWCPCLSGPAGRTAPHTHLVAPELRIVCSFLNPDHILSCRASIQLSVGLQSCLTLCVCVLVMPSCLTLSVCVLVMPSCLTLCVCVCVSHAVVSDSVCVCVRVSHDVVSDSVCVCVCMLVMPSCLTLCVCACVC